MYEVLKAARKASGITQADMCKALNRSMSYVPHVEQGKADVRFSEVVSWYERCNDIGKEIIRNHIRLIFFN